MPLEAISCTQCGSVEVTEVKANTYFCDHCEAVFKQVNLAGAMSGPQFCECGAAVMVKCTVCQVGMCQHCDAIGGLSGPRGSAYGYSVEPVFFAGHVTNFNPSRHWLCSAPPEPVFSVGPTLLIPTVGFGYIIVDQNDLPVLRDQSVFTVPAGHSIGPVLTLDDVLPVFQRAHSNIKHACWPCVVSVIPVVAESIANGAICEQPGCSSAASGNCPCCSSPFCECHLIEAMRLPVTYYRSQGLDIPTVEIQLPPACKICRKETQMHIQELVDEPSFNGRVEVTFSDYKRGGIDYKGLNVISYHNDPYLENYRLSKWKNAANDHARFESASQAHKLANEVAQRLEQILATRQSGASCVRRSDHFEEEMKSAPYLRGCLRYLIFDDRERIQPTAALVTRQD